MPSPAGEGAERSEADEVEASPALPLSLPHLKSPHAPLKERGRYFLSPKSNQKGPLIPGQRTHGLRGPIPAPLRNPRRGRPG